MHRLLWVVFPLVTVLLGGTPAPKVAAADKKEKDDEKGWVKLFNGKDLKGWMTHPKSKGKWEVKKGVIVGSGDQVSHLFSKRGDYQNFHFLIEARINDKGNSGQYFRTKFGPGYPRGYEAQINATHPDPQKTGSLYGFVPVKKQLHKPNEWFTQEVIAVGNHIIIKVKGKKVVDYVDKKNTYTKGHFAFQHHGSSKDLPDTVIEVRKALVKELPAEEKKK
jgi:hypothetical protein